MEQQTHQAQQTQPLAWEQPQRHGPVELDPALLQHVAGGLPRVGGWKLTAGPTEPQS